MSTKPEEQTDTNIFDTLISLAKSDKRFSRTLCVAAIDALDNLDKVERRRQARADRWTKKGDRRSIKAVEKGKKTAIRRRRQRSGARSSERRRAQRANHTARLFPREISAAAIVLSALEPGRWYLRSEIHGACPELPSGALEALLGRGLIQAGGFLEREPNPTWDGLEGTLRRKGSDTSPERLSRWRYRLTAAGGAAKNDVSANPAAWTVSTRRQAALERAQAAPKPHTWAAHGGRPVPKSHKAPADPS